MTSSLLDVDAVLQSLGLSVRPERDRPAYRSNDDAVLGPTVASVVSSERDTKRALGGRVALEKAFLEAMLLLPRGVEEWVARGTLRRARGRWIHGRLDRIFRPWDVRGSGFRAEVVLDEVGARLSPHDTAHLALCTTTHGPLALRWYGDDVGWMSDPGEEDVVIVRSRWSV
ncbi:MAG: hypothetical protein H6721_27140 [Sandaracinus sp.]|nr:hypothetical protein [Sandaracinus sp.]MCB9613845.1 hypothetical protein [Sandaracinus sp.]MCB9635810.1 hypothetical protein [Sandaracinus sp.]